MVMKAYFEEEGQPKRTPRAFIIIIIYHTVRQIGPILSVRHSTVSQGHNSSDKLTKSPMLALLTILHRN